MPSRRSNTGRSDRIWISRSKLCAGGGDEVAHSMVFASHGSSVAVRGFRIEMTKFTMKSRTDSAMRKAPAVASSF
jgi:hypothetical protein